MKFDFRLLLSLALLVLLILVPIIARAVVAGWRPAFRRIMRPRRLRRPGLFAMTLFGAAVALAACGGVAVPTTPAQSVYALEGALTASINLASQYKALPTCVAGGVALCSDPTTITRIQAAATSAATLVLAAEAATSDPSTSAAAQQAAIADAAQAVTALTALTSPLKTS
jgi:hypothetical protein